MAISAGLAYLIGAGITAAAGVGTNIYQNRKNEQYYNQYSSPAAMMSQMAAAGINPAAAAQGISNSSPSQLLAGTAGSDLLGMSGDLFARAPGAQAEQDYLESLKDNTDADTKNKGLEFDFNTATFQDRVKYLHNEGLISDETYKQAQELTTQYPELLTQTIEQIKSDIRKNDKQVEVYDQQIKNLKKEIDEIEEKIKLMKSQESLNSALAGEANARAKLEEAETTLTQKKQDLADIEKKKAELGSDSNVELKYREIEAKQGKEAADKWLQGQYDIVNKVEQGVQDANPLTKEQRKIIKSYDDRIAKAEKYAEECEDRYYNAGSFKKSWYKGEMEAAQQNVRNLRQQKAEELRRLGINESSTTHVGPVSVSHSK